MRLPVFFVLFALLAPPAHSVIVPAEAPLCGSRLLLLFVAHMRGEDVRDGQPFGTANVSDDLGTLRSRVHHLRAQMPPPWVSETGDMLWKQVAALPADSPERAAIFRELFVFLHQGSSAASANDEFEAWNELRHALWIASKLQERGARGSWARFYLSWLFAFFDRGNLWSATPARLVAAWIALRGERFVPVP